MPEWNFKTEDGAVLSSSCAASVKNHGLLLKKNCDNIWPINGKLATMEVLNKYFTEINVLLSYFLPQCNALLTRFPVLKKEMKFGTSLKLLRHKQSEVSGFCDDFIWCLKNKKVKPLCSIINQANQRLQISRQLIGLNPGSLVISDTTTILPTDLSIYKIDFSKKSNNNDTSSKKENSTRNFFFSSINFN